MSSRSRSVKSARQKDLSLSQKAALRSKAARNTRVATHRTGNAAGVKPALHRINEGRITLRMKDRVKMDVIVRKLRDINNDLEEAIEAYDEKVDAENSDSDLMTAVSMLFADIADAVLKKSDALPGFDASLESPADFVEALVEYINEKIVAGYKKAGNLAARIRMANTIMPLLLSSIAAHSSAIKGAMASEAAEDELADAMAALMKW